MSNVIRVPFNGNDTYLMVQSVSTVEFMKVAGYDTAVKVSFVGEPDAEATYDDPFVVQQFRALTELIPSTFTVNVEGKTMQFPFESVCVVLYDNEATEVVKRQEFAQVVLNNGTTVGLDVEETMSFRMAYGKWLDRKTI